MSTQTVRPTTDTAKRRGQAIAGALAGLAIVLVLVAVFVLVKANKSDTPEAAAPVPAAQPSDAAQPAPTQADTAQPEPAQPSAAAPPAANTPPGLDKAPVVKGGGATPLTKTVVTPLIKGTGATIKSGQTITVNYVLVKYADGTPIESSWDSGQPFSTEIGTGKLIKGWDQTIPGQKVGSRLQLDIPAALAYGPDPGDLRFVVDILAAK
ncbi:FKBP-type peptidyl-prolyl cis-trans isomerase [Micromonosporaceae bacterium Da 78-11]